MEGLLTISHTDSFEQLIDRVQMNSPHRIRHSVLKEMNTTDKIMNLPHTVRLESRTSDSYIEYVWQNSHTDFPRLGRTRLPILGVLMDDFFLRTTLFVIFTHRHKNS